MEPQDVTTSDAATTNDSTAEAQADREESRQVIFQAVRVYGDPVLRTRAREVEEFGEAIEGSVNKLLDLVKDAPAYGLAANQVGLLKRVFVYRLESEDPWITVINPVIEWSSEEQETMEEACFSLPGVVVEVERPVSIRFRCCDQHGTERVQELSGMEARIVQHETDHVEGILMLDRATLEQRREAIRTLREQG